MIRGLMHESQDHKYTPYVHDPLCPVTTLTDGQVTVVTFGPGTCQCVLVAKVRADERWKIIGVMERNADGDAIKVIDAVLDML